MDYAAYRAGADAEDGVDLCDREVWDVLLEPVRQTCLDVKHVDVEGVLHVF